MRQERLFSIVLTLADGRIHSASELAARFGVGQRSLYRDMDLLSGMGFPIEALPGREGGYRVLPGFTLDRSVLDEAELAAVAAALGGISRATGSPGAGGDAAGAAGSKIGALLARAAPRKKSWIRIELAGGERERGRIETLRRAIEESRLVLLAYRDAEGQVSERTVEPAAVVYLWQSWYLWAWCRLRSDWRLFKLARIDKAAGLMTRFEPRPEPSEDAWRTEWESRGPEALVLEIEARAGARADEWFGSDCEPRPDGGRIVRVSLPENEWLYGFLLSFGEGLRVVEPERIAARVAERALAIARAYDRTPPPAPESPAKP